MSLRERGCRPHQMIGGVHQLALPHQSLYCPADVGRFFLGQPQALGDHPRLERLIVRLVDQVFDRGLKFVRGHGKKQIQPLPPLPLKSFRSRFG